MRSMYGGNYWLAVRRAFFAKTEPAHAMAPPSSALVLTTSAATFAAPLLVLWATAYFVPITF